MVPDDGLNAVKAALERDTDINLHRFPLQISHDSRDHTLVLSGAVEDIIALRKTLQLARRAWGSGRIKEDLHIQPATKRSGEELRDALISTFSSEPALRDVRVGDARQGAPGGGGEQGWIVVDVEGSSVHLEGELNSLAARRLAEVLCWWVPGTSRVENRIHVQPPEQDSDEELAEAVHVVLEKDPSLDAGQIQVRTRDRRVQLAGRVRSEVNRRRASRDCWFIPGVHGVDNQLQVVE